MKKTIVTLLFTFAMLVGMAVAPNAQAFRWKAGESYDAVGESSRYRSSRHGYDFAANTGAQVATDADPCRDGGRYGDNDYERHCEVRESATTAGPLNVDAGQNGGIVVEGWDEGGIRVRAVVQAAARSTARAKEIADQVQVSVSSALQSLHVA